MKKTLLILVGVLIALGLAAQAASEVDLQEGDSPIVLADSNQSTDALNSVSVASDRDGDGMPHAPYSVTADRDHDGFSDAFEDTIGQSYLPHIWGAGGDNCRPLLLDNGWCQDGVRGVRHLPGFIAYDAKPLAFSNLVAIEYTVFLDYNCDETFMFGDHHCFDNEGFTVLLERKHAGRADQSFALVSVVTCGHHKTQFESWDRLYPNERDSLGHFGILMADGTHATYVHKGVCEGQSYGTENCDAQASAEAFLINSVCYVGPYDTTSCNGQGSSVLDCWGKLFARVGVYDNLNGCRQCALDHPHTDAYALRGQAKHLPPWIPVDVSIPDGVTYVDLFELSSFRADPGHTNALARKNFGDEMVDAGLPLRLFSFQDSSWWRELYDIKYQRTELWYDGFLGLNRRVFKYAYWTTPSVADFSDGVNSLIVHGLPGSQVTLIDYEGMPPPYGGGYYVDRILTLAIADGDRKLEVPQLAGSDWDLVTWGFGPTADAGPDQTIPEEEPVVLDASGSFKYALSLETLRETFLLDSFDYQRDWSYTWIDESQGGKVLGFGPQLTVWGLPLDSHRIRLEVTGERYPDPGKPASHSRVTVSDWCVVNIVYNPIVKVSVNATDRSVTYKVDGVPYSGPRNFVWQRNSWHSFCSPKHVVTDSTTRLVFERWRPDTTGDTAISLLMSRYGSLAAKYGKQYLLTNTAEGGGSVLPQSGWYSENSSAEIRAVASPSHCFSEWLGTGSGAYSGENESAIIMMSGPVTQIARFSYSPTGSRITIRTEPPGMDIYIDGHRSYRSPRTFCWQPGERHVAVVQDTVADDSLSRLKFVGWNVGGERQRVIDVGSNSLQLTASYRRQFWVTLSQSGEGVVTPQSAWVDSASVLDIAVHPNCGEFVGWEGSGAGAYSGEDTSAAILITAPVVEVARFGDAPEQSFVALSNPTLQQLNRGKDWKWIDIDRDGDLDIAVWNTAKSEVQIAYNSGGEFLQSIAVAANLLGRDEWAWVDLDRNGYLDVLTWDQGSGTVWASMNQAGALLEGRTIAGDLRGREAWMWVDHDGDGDVDLATRDLTHHEIWINRNDNGVLSSGTRVASNLRGDDGWEWVDYDNDGDTDIASWDAFSGEVWICRRNESSYPNVTQATSGLIGSNGWVWVDFDDDNDLDISVWDSHNSQLLISVNQSGVFSQAYVACDNLGGDKEFAWLDYDGNGYLDLATRDDNGTVWLAQNEGGDLNSKNRVQLPFGSNWYWTDLDNDGDLDLTARSSRSTGHCIAVARNEGGRFDAVEFETLRNICGDLAWAWVDVDDDGDPDPTTIDGRVLPGEGARLGLNRISCPDHHRWIRVRLHHHNSSPSDAMARLTVFSPSHVQAREVRSTGASASFISGNPAAIVVDSVAELIIGLGDDEYADSIVVRWTGGETSTVTHALSGSTVNIFASPNTPTGVDDDEELALPASHYLGQNFPNPFNPSCQIEFELQTQGFVCIDIMNSLGQKVRSLVSGDLRGGKHAVRWDGKDDSDRPVASGVYFYRMRTGDFVQTRKMILMK